MNRREINLLDKFLNIQKSIKNKQEKTAALLPDRKDENKSKINK